MLPDGVTIAIPNWNHELLLPRSASSALAAARVFREQDIPAEVLVVDDASRDGSAPLLRQLELLHWRDGLRVLALKRNGGLAAARNLILRESRQRFVVLLDADNELNPATLPLFRRTLLDTGAAVAYGNLLVRRVAASPGGAFGVLNNESVQPRLFRANYIDNCAMVDRRQLLEEGGYADGLPAHEDYEQWMHLVCAGRKLVFVPAVFGWYNILPHSMLREQVADGKGEGVGPAARRRFDQLGSRAHLPLASRHLRHHPDLGWL